MKVLLGVHEGKFTNLYDLQHFQYVGVVSNDYDDLELYTVLCDHEDSNTEGAIILSYNNAIIMLDQIINGDHHHL